MSAFNGLPSADTLKWSFTTRRVARSALAGLSPDLGSAVAGDLVLCRVVEIGQHRKIQLADRRLSEMYPGDLVVLCLGDRYAPTSSRAAPFWMVRWPISWRGRHRGTDGTRPQQDVAANPA